MDDQGGKPHGEKGENARLRPDRAAGQPTWSVQPSIRKMAGKKSAAVRHRIKERLSKIEAGMPANSEPQISGAFEGERKNEARKDDFRHATPVFPWIPTVNRAEEERQQDCGGPETDPFGQSELGVATKEKFLVKAYEDE